MSLAGGLSNAHIIEALRNGGCVLVMRHASACSCRPSHSRTASETARGYQLDEDGKNGARIMGEVIHQLHIYFGEVYCSPRDRARETAHLVGCRQPKELMQLDDSSDTDANAQAVWLRATAAQPPAPGTNILLVTHMGNILSCFADTLSSVAPGEVLVFKPNVLQLLQPLARVRIEGWPAILQCDRHLALMQ
ncbi:MAG: histidine phosphatase family protein [Steroidobacteraceae bacterium]